MGEIIKLAKRGGRWLQLPPSIITEVTAIMGISGSGKTYTGGRYAEEMHRLGAQFIAVEPVGNWYGLRLKANGKGRGLDIPIFGGDQGDLPLPKESGAEVARLLVKERISAVIDVSHFRKSHMRRWMADFAEEFFVMKRKNRSAVNLMLEEARVFVPQTLRKGDEGAARMLGAIEDIARRGRNYGIGLTLMDQRPQSVNKDVLNQAQNLIVLQLVGKHEKKAVREWVNEVAKSLSGDDWWGTLDELAKGEAFIWSPRRRIFEQVKISKKWTYDASATPEFGQEDKPPPKLSEINVGSIREALEATIEKAKETDPKELAKKVRAQQKRIAELERGLANEKHEAEAIVQILTPFEVEDFEDMTELVSGVMGDMDTSTRLLTDAAGTLKTLSARIAKAQATLAKLKASNPEAREAATKQRRTTAPARAPAGPQQDSEANDINKSEQRLLDSLARLESIGIKPANHFSMAFFARYKPTSGNFHNLRGKLKAKGFVQYVSGKTELTVEGAALANRPEKLPTTEELHQTVLGMVTASQRRLLAPLLEHWPDGLSNEELAEQADYRKTSGNFNNLRGQLRSLGLVIYSAPSKTTAADMLFLEG
jgi:hypothetical protein